MAVTHQQHKSQLFFHVRPVNGYRYSAHADTGAIRRLVIKSFIEPTWYCTVVLQQVAYRFTMPYPLSKDHQAYRCASSYLCPSPPWWHVMAHPAASSCGGPTQAVPSVQKPCTARWHCQSHQSLSLQHGLTRTQLVLVHHTSHSGEPACCCEAGDTTCCRTSRKPRRQ